MKPETIEKLKQLALQQDQQFSANYEMLKHHSQGGKRLLTDFDSEEIIGARKLDPMIFFE
jgi:hypothetical protein